jgi:hypothetical protein
VQEVFGFVKRNLSGAQRRQTAARLNAEAAGARSALNRTAKTHQTVHPSTPTETIAWGRPLACIYLDTYILYGVY